MEFLKGILSSETYTKLLEELKGKGKEGKDFELLPNDGTFIPITKFNEVNEGLKTLKTQIQERDTQLEGLKKSSGDSEGLKKTIKELQDTNEKTKTDYETKTKDMTISNAIKLSLAGKVHDVDLVTGLFDKSKIELDESGNVKAGLDDQLKSISETKKFLFVDDTTKFKGATPFDTGDGTDNSKTDAFLQGFDGN